MKNGLRALLQHHRGRIEDGAAATDSLSFDETDPNGDSPCFDYLLGARCGSAEAVAALEIHPAVPHEVRKVVRKQVATRELLLEKVGHCPVTRWCWIASGKVDISPNAGERRLLAANRIEPPRSVLRLCPP